MGIDPVTKAAPRIYDVATDSQRQVTQQDVDLLQQMLANTGWVRRTIARLANAKPASLKHEFCTAITKHLDEAGL